jgi:hypothetical protein
VTTFKAGDRVKDRGSYGLGTVLGRDAEDHRYEIRFDDYTDYDDSDIYDSQSRRGEDIELVKRPSDVTDPDYYRFGDVEVRQISGHLTGFGAQALQYIARATRLDGQNKGDAVEDLRKAVRFIEWEIERLEGQ